MTTAALDRLPTGQRERWALHATLDTQRRHVIGILEGLDERALRTPVGPSGWSCLALVQHLTRDVERFWFRGVVAGQPAVTGLEMGTNNWTLAADATAEGVLAAYRAQVVLADAVIIGTPVLNAPAWWPPDVWGDWRLADMREVLLHVITETACHAGHLDAAREAIDGRRWMVL